MCGVEMGVHGDAVSVLLVNKQVIFCFEQLKILVSLP